MALPGTAAVTDFGQYAQLRAAARSADPEALRAAAKQFEALFTQQLLKSMRAASVGEDILGSEQTEFYQDMFDQQLAVHLAAGKGLGIAELLIRQLQQAAAADPAAASPLRPPVNTAVPAMALPPMSAPAATTATTATTTTTGRRSQAAFVEQLWPHARQAAQALGVSPRALVAQAALETDWGRRMIQLPDGSSSLNFFGIKADKAWDGPRASSVTREYMNGQPTTETAAFRAYGSIAEGFADYVRFIRDNPRYRAALAHGGDDQHYLQGLQRAGYATDPDYAAKISRVADSPVFGGAARDKVSV